MIKNNKPAAALVGIDKRERLQRVEEDVELLTVALVRTAIDTDDRVSLADAAARFGIDLDALNDEVDADNVEDGKG